MHVTVINIQGLQALSYSHIRWHYTAKTA